MSGTGGRGARGRRRAGPRSERGTGLLGTVLGLGVLLSFVLLASHVLVNLWVSSSIDGVAEAAARDVALAPHGGAAPPTTRGGTDLAGADARVRSILAGLSPQVRWSVDERAVRVTVSTRAVGILPHPAARALGLHRLERTVRVGREVLP